MHLLQERDLEAECITAKLSDKGGVHLHAFGEKAEYMYMMGIGEDPAVINWQLKDADDGEREI